MDTDLELICMQWKSHISFLSPHEYLPEYSYWEDCPFSVILQSLLRGKSSVQIRMQLCLDYFAWLVNLSSLSLKLYYFNYHRVKQVLLSCRVSLLRLPFFKTLPGILCCLHFQAHVNMSLSSSPRKQLQTFLLILHEGTFEFQKNQHLTAFILLIH